LSRYVRRAEAGECVIVTAHGRAVAELRPPTRAGGDSSQRRYSELTATGVIRSAVDRTARDEWPDIRLPRGTVRTLVDADRDEA
jgi:antitoxin (DNA-binding transcriptional repressor) of toxin-antitoxin stability system